MDYSKILINERKTKKKKKREEEREREVSFDSLPLKTSEKE